MGNAAGRRNAKKSAVAVHFFAQLPDLFSGERIIGLVDGSSFWYTSYSRREPEGGSCPRCAARLPGVRSVDRTIRNDGNSTGFAAERPFSRRSRRCSRMMR
jgi:hypothetical protein